MADIYDQHSKAFERVCAFVIVGGGQRIGSVALQRSAPNLTTTAYVHIAGSIMVRGFARGGGYDKASAAVEAAVAKIKPHDHADARETDAIEAIRKALAGDSGARWDSRLREYGFDVWQAV